MMFSNTDRTDLTEIYWDQYLKGGVTTSEFAIYLAKDAETAFVHGADLSAILTACATIETYLRSEVGKVKPSISFKELIDQSSLPSELVDDLQRLRVFRNRWVHVSDPSEDQMLLERADRTQIEIAEHAELAIRSMIRTICSNPWV